MPLLPLSSQARRQRERLKLLQDHYQTISTTENQNSMKQPTKTQLYATLNPPADAKPMSWLKMNLQRHSLSMREMMERWEVVIVVQNRFFIYIMESCNNQVWLATVLNTHMKYPFPHIPFFHKFTMRHHYCTLYRNTTQRRCLTFHLLYQTKWVPHLQPNTGVPVGGSTSNDGINMIYRQLKPSSRGHTAPSKVLPHSRTTTSSPSYYKQSENR